ncbi:DNA-processing protein DprA [Thalassolituus sp. LLYu03]|uniref:DNA-processing protein DprA n=1 Tax=Thalassolituus sp. LLYu03 TaxID=3421656 RepID=UPI003D2760E7
MLRDELLQAWWRLAQLPGVGNVSLNDIRTQLGAPGNLLKTPPEQLIALGLSADAVDRYQHDDSLSMGFEAVRQWRHQNRCGVLLAGMAPYPQQLAAVADAPLMLFYHGDLEALNLPMVGMVGSRNPTPYGLEWAQQAAAELTAAGVCVVSGLALGIDGAAHQGALKNGRTVAVLGTGPDVIYPQRHLGLAQMVMQKGLLLSEFPPGTPAKPEHFPSRNRIISGLSLGVVVVEAAIKSGSLITARQAAEQGREVFALPGAVTNPLSHGCHQLIRDGAILVQSAADVLQELSVGQTVTAVQAELPLSNSRVPVLVTHIDYAATSTDVIAIRSALSISQLLPQLLDLELQGWLAQVPGGYMRLK